jgi:transcriptional regulator
MGRRRPQIDVKKEIRGVLFLRKKGNSFKEIGLKFGRTKGWASYINNLGKIESKKTREQLDLIVRGLLSGKVKIRFESSPVERIRIKKWQKDRIGGWV